MRFIDIEHRAVPLRQRDQDRQIGAVAIHAEHAFADDQHMRILGAVLTQQCFEMIAIIMLKPYQPRPAQHRALQQGMVDQAIRQYRHWFANDLGIP